MSIINQRRASACKSSDVLLKAVAQIVSEVTSDPEVILAAWLYDVVEDSPATFEMIEREFGAADRVIKDLESPRNNLAHAQDLVTHDWPRIARLAYRILAAQDDG